MSSKQQQPNPVSDQTKKIGLSIFKRALGCAAASGMAVPAMDGTMGASYLTMRGQKHVPRTDDRSA